MEKLTIITNRIIRLARGWITLAAVIIFLIFSVTVLPDQSAKAAAYSAEIGSPDLSLFYTPEDLYHMAEQFGESGRQAYVRARFTFDLAFPIVYGAFLLSCVGWALGKLTLENSNWRLLVLIPLFAVLFDLFENTAASIVISQYPQPSPLAAVLAPFFTLLKWFFVGSGFLLAATLPLLYGIKLLKK